MRRAIKGEIFLIPEDWDEQWIRIKITDQDYDRGWLANGWNKNGDKTVRLGFNNKEIDKLIEGLNENV